MTVCFWAGACVMGRGAGRAFAPACLLVHRHLRARHGAELAKFGAQVVVVELVVLAAAHLKGGKQRAGARGGGSGEAWRSLGGGGAEGRGEEQQGFVVAPRGRRAGPMAWRPYVAMLRPGVRSRAPLFKHLRAPCARRRGWRRAGP